MAKLYGERWEIVGPQIGTGGQSEVFPVRDLVGEHIGTFALKRVRNPKRRERFISEVEAIKRIRSEHVVELIDHSALDASLNAPSEKQFLVMPLLSGGDLAKRAPGFAKSLDAVLIVVKQIAQGLADAHAVGVVHRDIKPANVLFVDNGNTIKLCDFGICLIQDRPRVTSTDEAVGPWTFMAPELEGGGHLEVSAAADLYSLGKLIYFMLSGGRLLSRERVDEPAFVATFSGGERYTDLLSLTRRLISADPRARVQTAAEVITAIERIEGWEKRAHTLALSEHTRAALDGFKRAEMDIRTAQAARASVLAQHKVAVAAVRDALRNWLYGELCKLRDAISTSEVIARVEEPASKTRSSILLAGMRDTPTAMPLAELHLTVRRERTSRTMGIAFVLCEIVTGRGVIIGRMPQPPVPEPQLAIFPLFLETQQVPDKRPVFMNPPNATVQVIVMGRPTYQKLPILKFSVFEGTTILTRFETKDWPRVQDNILRDIDAAFAGLLQILQADSYTITG